MPGNFRKDDLRVEKTLTAIREAFLRLLGNRAFEQITVNKLCEEAQISRRTFYLHFCDKYDLLKYCLTDIGRTFKLNVDDSIRFAQEYGNIISNLMKDANDETLDLLHAFILSFIDLGKEKDEDGKVSPRYIVLSNFCAGGIMQSLSWQIEHKFPQDLQRTLSTQSISLLIHMMKWGSDQNNNDRGRPPYDEPSR